MKRLCKLTVGAVGLLFLGVVLAAGDASAQTAKDFVGTWTLVSSVTEQGGTKTSPRTLSRGAPSTIGWRQRSRFPGF